jgi:CubicO group peptidase (beta-lactamase class C family)
VHVRWSSAGLRSTISIDATVPRLAITLAIVLAVATVGQRTSAQGLTSSLLERYLESLRAEAGIPGMSALVAQNGAATWSAGFGYSDLEGAVRATSETPYLIGGLSQTFGATLLLKECIEEGPGELSDPVAKWVPEFSEPRTTLAELLGHVTSTGAFKLDLTRFAALTPVIESCADESFTRLLYDKIFSQLGMPSSVPGTALGSPTATDLDQFTALELARFSGVIGRLAKPYRIASGRQVRSEVPAMRVNASTVHDLQLFDSVLRPGLNHLLEWPTVVRAWSPVAPNLPAGLGWFVQNYNGELVVWQFGQVQNGYSSLLVKAPNRGLTFILLANSDALAAPFSGSSWDVTASAFARTFLKLYIG